MENFNNETNEKLYDLILLNNIEQSPIIYDKIYKVCELSPELRSELIKCDIVDTLLKNIHIHSSNYQILLTSLYLMFYITQPKNCNYKACNKVLLKENISELFKILKANKFGCDLIDNYIGEIVLGSNKTIEEKINHDKHVIDLMTNSFC